MSVYIYQLIGLFIQAQVNVSLDMINVYLLYIASIKFEILGARLVKLGNIKEARLNNVDDVNLGIKRKNQWIQEGFEKKRALIKCVVSYQKIWQ